MTLRIKTKKHQPTSDLQNISNFIRLAPRTDASLLLYEGTASAALTLTGAATPAGHSCVLDGESTVKYLRENFY